MEDNFIYFLKKDNLIFSLQKNDDLSLIQIEVFFFNSCNNSVAESKWKTTSLL